MLNIDDRNINYEFPQVSGDYKISTFIVSKTFGINNVGDMTSILSGDVTFTVYNPNEDTYSYYNEYLNRNYDENELIFDFENGKIYYGEDDITVPTFSQYYENITGVTIRY